MEQILRMVMRQVMRRVINMGISKGLNAFGGKRRPPSQTDKQPPVR